MKRCVLGVDMGSTNTKAIASDLEGRQIAYASRRTQMHSSRSREGFRRPANTWWR